MRVIGHPIRSNEKTATTGRSHVTGEGRRRSGVRIWRGPEGPVTLPRAPVGGPYDSRDQRESMDGVDPTTLLTEWRSGNRAALDALFPIVYDELRRRARGYLRSQPVGHTLTTTALVHETYLKLIAVEHVRWEDRAHFTALAARAMRHVLVDYARRTRAAKRGGGVRPTHLEDAPAISDLGADQLLALDEALNRLAQLNERLSRTVELRFFGGMTTEEIAGVLNVAQSTVKLDWQKAKAWLYRELGDAS